MRQTNFLIQDKLNLETYHDVSSATDVRDSWLGMSAVYVAWLVELGLLHASIKLLSSDAKLTYCEFE